MELAVLGPVLDVLLVAVMGGFIRYHMARLKELESKIATQMSRDEIRMFVHDQVRDKFKHLEYMINEVKLDIGEIKMSLREIQKEKPR